jgi:hypothetical protein
VFESEEGESIPVANADIGGGEVELEIVGAQGAVVVPKQRVRVVFESADLECHDCGAWRGRAELGATAR